MPALDGFYVASPGCSPSRGALLTGQHSVKTGLYGEKINVFHPEDPNGIPSALMTLPEALEPLGYTSAIMGKWHSAIHRISFQLGTGLITGSGCPTPTIWTGQSPPIDEVMRAIASNDLSQLAGGFQALIDSFADPKEAYWNVRCIAAYEPKQAFVMNWWKDRCDRRR